MWCRGVVFVVLCSGLARAEPDRFFFGDGHRGATVISSPRTLNAYAMLTTDVAAGAATAQVSSTLGFSPGDVVLFIQMQSALVGHDAGLQDPLTLAADPVGVFEFARLDAVMGNALRLTQPLGQTFPGQLTQVLTVPEYTDVTVTDGGVITAPGWNGATGGVVALWCTGTLTNDGLVTAAGLGFRGGMSPAVVGTTCSGLDDPGAGSKGESVAPGAFGATVRGVGNIANGGGGSDCNIPTRGGGGGSQLGRGGNGSTVGGGLGGRPLVFEPTQRLLFGGGGGAGGLVAIVSAAGGAGGGIVMVRCRDLEGRGVFDVSGLQGRENVYMDTAPGGGGGAGGSLWLQAAQRLTCGAARAEGGRGADVNRPNAAAGGGGGGVLVLQGSSGTCRASARAGAAGLSNGQPSTAAPLQVDQAPAVGRVVVFPSGLSAPEPPRLTGPMPLERVGPRPWVTGVATRGTTALIWAGPVKVGELPIVAQAFAGTLDVPLPGGLVGLHATVREASLESGQSARVFVEVEATPDGGPPVVDGPPGLLVETVAHARCDRPFEYEPVIVGSPGPFSIAPVGGAALPEGLELDPASGALRWTPSAAQTGTHRLVLRPATGTPLALRVNVACEYQVACGCGGGEVGLVGLLALMRRRRREH